MRKIAIFLLVIALVAPAAYAATYEIKLDTGVSLVTLYPPFVASFDASLLMFMTDQSNWMTVPIDSVEEVVALEEALGFGQVIDDVTIMIGFTVNDNLSPEEEAALEAEFAAAEAEGRYNDYSIPTFSEPNAGTGGIPLGFLNQTTPPMGGARGVGGAPANQRRGGGGAAGEPFTRRD